MMKLWQKLADFFRQSSHDVTLISLVMVVSTYYMVWHRQQRQAEQLIAWQQQLVQAQAEARRARVAAAAAQSRLAYEQQRAEAMQRQVAVAQQ